MINETYEGEINEQLERLGTYLAWNSEHLASFKAFHTSRNEAADQELAYLENTVEKSYEHYLKLVELLNSLERT